MKKTLLIISEPLFGGVFLSDCSKKDTNTNGVFSTHSGKTIFDSKGASCHSFGTGGWCYNPQQL